MRLVTITALQTATGKTRMLIALVLVLATLMAAAAPAAPALAQEAVEEEAVEERVGEEGAAEEGVTKEGDTRREAARDGATQNDKATLSFELTVDGDPPPADAAFYGHVHTGEGGPGLYVPLTDPDKDGLYTGSTTVDRFGPGPRPVPPGVEPVSLPVRIVQDSELIKDFGTVKLDGDKTFSASISFDDEEPNPEEVLTTGRIVEIADYPGASHAIIDEASGVRYLLTSDSVDLQEYAVSGERVVVYGTPVPNRYTTETILDVTRVERAGAPPPDNDGSDNGGSDNGGSDNGGSGNDGSGSRGGSSDGGVASGIRGLLPSTGGSMALTLLGAGVLMTSGGLLVRRIFR